MRSVISIPYQSLYDEYQELLTYAKVNLLQRKKIKFMSYINKVFDKLKDINDNYNIIGMSMILGPSINNYKEIYSLRFNSIFTDLNDIQGSIKNDINEKFINRDKRLLMHKLIEIDNQLDCNLPYKTNVFITVCVVIKYVDNYNHFDNIIYKNHSLLSTQNHIINENVINNSNNDNKELNNKKESNLININNKDFNIDYEDKENLNTISSHENIFEYFSFRDNYEIKEKKHRNIPINININQRTTLLNESTSYVDTTNECIKITNNVVNNNNYTRLLVLNKGIKAII